MGVKIWVGICVIAIVIGFGARFFWGGIQENAVQQEGTAKPLLTEETQEHVHDYIRGVWESPTCQKSGYYNNICKECGVVECVMQEPISHESKEIVLQEGNCMSDTIIRHECTMCGMQTLPDTHYTENNLHNWLTEQIEGTEVTYCTWCGVVP